MSDEGSSWIGMTRVVGTGAVFRGHDPAADLPLAVDYRSLTAADVDRAAKLASSAFRIYGRLPARVRADFLRDMAARLEADEAGLCAIARQETGLPLARLQGERARTSLQLRFYAEWVEQGSCLDARIDRADPARKPAPRPDVRSVLRPIGPVAVFGSSNFPFAYSVAGGDTASALAAGCPVIVKAHPAHPGTSERTAASIVSAAKAAGLPDGVFSLLFDAGHDVGAALVRHPLVRAVGFTGSLRGGRALMDLAAARLEPIPVYAEMGSVNPVFILPGALETRAAAIAEGLHASITLGVGQFCTNPGIHVLPSTPHTRPFLLDLSARITATPAAPMLTPSIAQQYRRGVQRLEEAFGVGVLARAKAQGPNDGAAVLLTTDGKTFLRDSGLSDEVFGPCSLAVVCADTEEMLAVAGSFSGQLTATIHAAEQDFAGAQALQATLEQKAGRLIFNGFPTGVEVNHAIVHGGPYPASSDVRTTSVGTRAVLRFLRPVCYQQVPESLLPDELKTPNPLGIPRLMDGRNG